MEREGYQANSGARCYFCKAELIETLQPIADEFGITAIATGTNADDAIAGFRPGIRAAFERGALTPLRDARLTKAQIRTASRSWGLETSDKPAAACLSSRIAYGVSVTPERLHRIDLAERELRALKLGAVRVRLHENELARLEVPVDALPRLCADGVRESLVARFRELGFRYITLDLEGFRSGSFKQLVAIEDLTRFASQS
jgi:uncharacterized protein